MHASAAPSVSGQLTSAVRACVGGQLLRCDVEPAKLMVELDPSLANTYRLSDDGEVFKLTLKTSTDKSKFALQVREGTR